MQMMTPSQFTRRLLYLFRRDHHTAELEEEMRLHVQLRAAQLQGGGLGPGAAHFAAARRFGNRTETLELSRDMWGFRSLDQLVADLRFAFRRLRRRPGLSVATITVAALGIGATTTVFSAVDAAILRPLPFLRPNELVWLRQVLEPYDPGTGIPPSTGPRHILRTPDVAAMHDAFASVAAYAAGGLNIEDPSRSQRVNAGVVTVSFFPTLGVSARQGRTFIPDEGRPNGPKSVIISDALWRTHFGGAGVLGKRLELSGTTYTIVGVMPPRFSFPSESDLWIPMTDPNTPETFAAFRNLISSSIIARVAPGVSVADASRRLMARWELGAGTSNPVREKLLNGIVADLRAQGGAAIPLQRSMVPGDRRVALLVLLGATALLLLIACANIANLLLSDAATRTREIALREVLGASKGRIIRQLLAESLLLSTAGAAIGLVLAPTALGLMGALLPQTLAGTAPVHVDVRVLGFAVGIALATGLVFGLWPALGTSTVDPVEAMKSGGHGATSGRLGRARRMLISAELALSVMLLVGCGLMLKSFYRLMSQDFGLDPEQVSTLEISVARNRPPSDRLRVIHGVLDQVAGDPTIRATAVGVVNFLPLGGSESINYSIKIDGVSAPKPGEETQHARYLSASGGYFRSMGIPIIRGRTFKSGDDTVGQRAAIVSQAMANKYWPNSDPLNRTFHFMSQPDPYTVVGISGDFHEDALDAAISPQMYFSIDDKIPLSLAVVVRSQLPSAALLKRLTSAIHKVDPTQAVYNVRTMDAVIGKSVAPRRTNTALIAIFAGLALVLSAFGVYAVVSYSVTQRSREFGIRSALGADQADILLLVTREMVAVVTLGLVVGLAGAWALVRTMASMLFSVPTHDTTVFVAVPLILLIPAAVATLIPAIKAMRVSPAAVMRAE